MAPPARNGSNTLPAKAVYPCKSSSTRRKTDTSVKLSTMSQLESKDLICSTHWIRRGRGASESSKSIVEISFLYFIFLNLLPFQNPISFPLYQFILPFVHLYLTSSSLFYKICVSRSSLDHCLSL